MTEYTKLALTTDQHIVQWQQRGLQVSDTERARRYLNVISYYRLSAYTLPFQIGNPDHHFKKDTQFDQVLDLYVFDRELRLLVIDAIERIEVAIRCQLGNYMALQYGPHWYLDESHFIRSYAYQGVIGRH